MNLWITTETLVDNRYITSTYPQVYRYNPISCGYVDNLVKSFHRYSTGFLEHISEYVEFSTADTWASSSTSRYIIYLKKKNREGWT